MKFCSIIKYEGPNNTLVWKNPDEDFNTTSQLIVHESQEAVFFCDGQICDIFRSGRYTLTTDNIPVLRHIINIPTDGETPFHCEVYFVNLVDSMDLMWGTSSPITIKDPVYDIILPVGANGQFGVRVTDSKKLLTKLVGTVEEFTQRTVNTYFKGLLMTNIKDTIGKQMIDNKLSFLEVNSHLSIISESIQTLLADKFDIYGIKIINFCVSAIAIPEDNPSYVKLKEALARKAEMGVVGYNYGQERTFDVLEKAASNEGNAGTVMGAGMGLGMGINVGGAIAGAMSDSLQNITTSTSNKCGNCRKDNPIKAVFCLQCGNSLQNSDSCNCSKCNAIVPKGAFCIKCGNKLSSVCKKCGAELPNDAAFCLKCGEKQ